MSIKNVFIFKNKYKIKGEIYWQTFFHVFSMENKYEKFSFDFSNMEKKYCCH